MFELVNNPIFLGGVFCGFVGTLGLLSILVFGYIALYEIIQSWITNSELAKIVVMHGVADDIQGGRRWLRDQNRRIDLWVKGI